MISNCMGIDINIAIRIIYENSRSVISNESVIRFFSKPYWKSLNTKIIALKEQTVINIILYSPIENEFSISFIEHEHLVRTSIFKEE